MNFFFYFKVFWLKTAIHTLVNVIPARFTTKIVYSPPMAVILQLVWIAMNCIRWAQLTRSTMKLTSWLKSSILVPYKPPCTFTEISSLILVVSIICPLPVVTLPKVSIQSSWLAGVRSMAKSIGWVNKKSHINKTLCTLKICGCPECHLAKNFNLRNMERV